MDRTIFTDEHLMFRNAFRRFVAQEITPNFLQWEQAGIVPRELFKKAGANGFLAMQAPQHYGGGGSDDFRYNAIVGEELMYAGTGGAGLGLTLHNDITLPYFLHFTNDEQKQRWLPGICTGELITAVAMTEPGIGRWPIFPPMLEAHVVSGLLSFAMVIPLILWDRKTLGSLHWATKFGLGALAFGYYARYFVWHSAAWHNFVAVLPG